MKTDSVVFNNNVVPSFKTKKVSVIIPIYNQEKYLATALDSLQNQTLKDFEVICVNDGSKDNSLNILNKYAAGDSRIKIINQENQGIGRTRNNGLKVAKGEYIAFLDPDDTFEKNALESLYKQAKKQDCDILAFNYKKVDENGKLLGLGSVAENLKYVLKINPNETFTWKNFKEKVFGGLFTASWNKLYNNDFIHKNKLHFSKSSLGEDHVFVYGATLAASKIGYSDNYFYNYLIHPNSAVRSVSDKHLDIFKAMDAITNLVKKLGLTKELEKEYNKYIMYSISRHERLIKSKSKFEQLSQRFLSEEQLKILHHQKQVMPKLFDLLDSLKRAK